MTLHRAIDEVANKIYCHDIYCECHHANKHIAEAIIKVLEALPVEKTEMCGECVFFDDIVEAIELIRKKI